MLTKFNAQHQLNGSYGQIYWNGELIFEINSFEAKVNAKREDVGMAGSLDVDSKLLSLSGEGSFKVKKAYTRGINKMLESWKKGEDPRSQIIGKLDDPASYQKQAERVVINNVWFNELTLMSFEHGKLAETEFPFGYTVSDVSMPDTINV